MTTNEAREEINLTKLRALVLHEKEYVCLSSDKMTNRAGSVPPESVSYNKTHGMMTNLIIREKAPIMMITNHTVARFKEDGLCNGLCGYIDFIQVNPQDPEIVDVIWMVPKSKKVGKKCYIREMRHRRPEHSEAYLDSDALPILPIRRAVEVTCGGAQFLRKQFPLTLCYAKTAHKARGVQYARSLFDTILFINTDICLNPMINIFQMTLSISIFLKLVMYVIY